MPQTLKKRCKLTLRWSLDLENTSLEQNETFGLFALYPCDFFVCCLVVSWLTFGYYWGNSRTHLVLKSMHLGYQLLVQRWIRGVGSLHLIECPVVFDCNGITQLAIHLKLQKILSPYLPLDSPKCGNAPNTPNSYSLTLVAFRLA